MTTEFMRRLSLSQPIVLGPFGGGFSTATLTAAVSNAGGLGSFGAHHLPPDRILQTATDIRALTGKPFALNLWASNHDPGGANPGLDDMRRVLARLRPYFDELGLQPGEPAPRAMHSVRDQLQAVLEAKPAVLSVVFGPPPSDVIRECQARDIMVVGGATTPDEALALAAAGVDAIVASGFEGGGHRPSFLAPAEDSLLGTMALTPQLASLVDLPIIAAGGIADARGVAAALQLGAQAAQIGTAFLACDESAAPAIHREELFSPRARWTVLSRVYSGRVARGIRNRLYDELRDADRLPYPAQGWLIGLLRDAAIEQERPDLISLWCGQAAGLLTHRRAAELVASLAGD